MKRISADEENSAEQWWECVAASNDVPPPIQFLLETNATEVTVSDLEAENAIEWAEQLPGWSDGPEYAPTALTVHDAD